MTTRIAIADDHPVVRVGTRTVLEIHGGYCVAGQAGGPQELFDVLDGGGIDLVITDFCMPGCRLPDGHTMLDALRRRYPQVPIILMTMFTSATSLQLALRAGVRGLVDKAGDVGSVLQAVEAVHGGRVFIDPRLAERLGPTDAGGRLSCLSPKELEVLRMYASGGSISEIALRLSRTVSTISRQRMSAMRRLGVRNEAELFTCLLGEGLINGSECAFDSL